MEYKDIVDASWIPAVVCAISLGMGIKILVSKDPGIVKKELRNKVLKYKDKYCDRAGKLLLVMAAASLAMAIVLPFYPAAATLMITGFLIILAILWKKMEDDYGPL